MLPPEMRSELRLEIPLTLFLLIEPPIEAHIASDIHL